MRSDANRRGTERTQENQTSKRVSDATPLRCEGKMQKSFVL